MNTGRQGTQTIEAAPLDLLVRNVRILSVATGEQMAGDIGVRQGRIVSLRPLGPQGRATEVIDGKGRIALPGFVDAHLHIESSFLTPEAFAPAVLARGTTTVAADPHEIANIAGEVGVRAMLAASRRLALSVFYLVPSCVPSVPGLETSGAQIGASEARRLLRHPRMLGLGEVMDYRGVVEGDRRIHDILAEARARGSRARIEGHAPNLRGADLDAFMAAGVMTDHTDNDTEAWLGKMRYGMFAELQYKSLRPDLAAAMHDLPRLAPFALVTDDVMPDTLVEEGHLDRVARRAVAVGMDPLDVVRALTLWPAGHLGLTDRGQLSPGRRADIVLVDDLATFRAAVVVSGGRIVARDGHALAPGPARAGRRWAMFRDSLRLGGPGAFTAADFAWHLGGAAGPRLVAAMGWRETDNRTAACQITLPVGPDGLVDWVGRTSLVRVIERYTGEAGTACAPVVGLALEAHSAVATTYSHDSHNLTVVGSSPEAMAKAACAVVQAQGGIAVVGGGDVLALLPLPIAGILAEEGAGPVAGRARAVRAAMERIGYRHFNAFMSVATLALLVSLERKISDRGLVDVDRRALTPRPEGMPVPSVP